MAHGGNAGLNIALDLIKPIKEKYENISWADFLQMASVAGIEVCGGPKIELKYGRVDATSEADCPVEGRLPCKLKNLHTLIKDSMPVFSVVSYIF